MNLEREREDQSAMEAEREQLLTVLVWQKFGFQFVNSYTALMVTAFLLNHVTLFSVEPQCESAPDEKQVYIFKAVSDILCLMQLCRIALHKFRRSSCRPC